MREPYSLKWFDFEINGGISFPGALTKTDYDNHGVGQTDQVNNFLYANFGAGVQAGAFGASATGELLRYTVPGAAAGQPALNVTAGRYHVLGAYGIASGQVVVGAGFRAVTMQLAQSGGILSTFNPIGASLTMTGLAPEIGVIVKPDNLPFRLGATFRAGVSGQDFGHADTTKGADGVVRSGGVIVPDAVTLPWELETGFAIQVGPRPLNPAWINPHEQVAPVHERIAAARRRRARDVEVILAEIVPEHRAERAMELAQQEVAIQRVEQQALDVEEARLKEDRTVRYQNWPREKILVVVSALITGASTNAIALEDFLIQKREPYGDHVTVSPRIGIEAEPIRNWVKGRLGTYVEPSRFDAVSARQHFTFGGDLRLFAWEAFGLLPGQVWRLSAGLDLAPRYVNAGVSVGAWH